MIKILPITKVREDLPNIVSRAKRLFQKYVITVKGVPQVVLLSHDEYQSIIETIDILSDPETMKEIRLAGKELKQGKYVTLEELQDELGITHVRT